MTNALQWRLYGVSDVVVGECLTHVSSFIWQGMLPLSGLSLKAVSLDTDTSRSPHMFEISSESVVT